MTSDPLTSCRAAGRCRLDRVDALARQQERFHAIQQPVLLLGGSRSPRYLKAGLTALERVLPHARRMELAELDHGGSSDPSATNRTGDPARVAAEVRRFFAEG